MKKYFTELYENNSEIAPIALFMFIIVALFWGASAWHNHSEEQKEKQENEMKSNMTQDEVIKYEASKSYCTKRTGSRPSCWQKTDWDLFFLEYCNRLPHQCENNAKKE